MDPMMISLLLSAADGGYKIYQANQQEQKAQELIKNNPGPTMKIPSGFLTAETLARYGYDDKRLPGQTNMEASIDRNGANSVRQMLSSGNPNDVLNAISSINDNSNQAYNKIGEAAAGRQDAQRSAYGAIEEKKGDWENKVFDYNETDPYMKAMAAASAYKNAANQNQYSGVKDILDTGIMGLGEYEYGAGQTKPTNISATDNPYTKMLSQGGYLNSSPSGTPGNTYSNDGNNFFMNLLKNQKNLPGINVPNLGY